jgi:enolase
MTNCATIGNYRLLPIVHVYRSFATAKSTSNQSYLHQLFCQGFDVTNQEAIDKFMIELDGTDNKGKIPHGVQ